MAVQPGRPLPDLPPSNVAKARQKMMVDLLRREHLSIRELGRRFSFSLGHKLFVGTPKIGAGFMEDWSINYVCDGFTMLSPYLPKPQELFVAGVVPQQQRRGLFWTEYEDATSRVKLGLPFKPHRYTGFQHAVVA